MATEIRVPNLGESIVEATVGQWFKQTGDAVSAAEPLVELETDKATVRGPRPGGSVALSSRRQTRRDVCGRCLAGRHQRGGRQGKGGQVQVGSPCASRPRGR